MGYGFTLVRFTMLNKRTEHFNFTNGSDKNPTLVSNTLWSGLWVRHLVTMR